MLPHTQLTIIRNRHRARELREFRNRVEVYFERSERDADDMVMDWEGARAARADINRMLPRIIRIVRAAGIGGPLASQTVTDPGVGVGRADVLERIFTVRYGDGVDQEIFDVLDMAIGVYDSDVALSLLRTINPLYYAGRLLSFLGRGPRRAFTAIGFGRGPAHDAARLARLEALASRLGDVEDLIGRRFAALQDHQSRYRADQVRQVAELAERLDFIERVLARPDEPRRIPSRQEQEPITPL